QGSPRMFAAGTTGWKEPTDGGQRAAARNPRLDHAQARESWAQEARATRERHRRTDADALRLRDSRVRQAHDGWHLRRPRLARLDRLPPRAAVRAPRGACHRLTSPREPSRLLVSLT